MKGYTIDVGNNLAGLGWGYLFLKFVLPVIGGIIIAALIVWLASKILPTIQIPLTGQTMIALIVAGIIIAAGL